MNDYLARLKREKNIARTQGYLFAMSTFEDCARIAANEYFGAGAKRNCEFMDCLRAVEMEMYKLIDQDNDKEMIYAKTKIDERLKPIMGERFIPYDLRHGRTK